MLARPAERYLALAAVPTPGYVVRVRPEQVVEIDFDRGAGLDPRSGGLALRFAGAVRYCDDKSAAEADTIDVARAFYNPGQGAAT